MGTQRLLTQLWVSGAPLPETTRLYSGRAHHLQCTTCLLPRSTSLHASKPTLRAPRPHSFTEHQLCAGTAPGPWTRASLHGASPKTMRNG